MSLFSHCSDRNTQEKQLKEGFLPAHSLRVQSNVEGKHNVASHRKQRRRPTVLFCFLLYSFLFSQGQQPIITPPHINRESLPPQLNDSGTLSWTLPEMCHLGDSKPSQTDNQDSMVYKFFLKNDYFILCVCILPAHMCCMSVPGACGG